jgi:S-adenosylmethionine hydrolase
MPILTMTTDWGLRDSYVAAFKGEIYSLLPAVVIIDVTHLITVHDRLGAAHIVGNTYPHFPEGTVHFIGVYSKEGSVSKEGSNFLVVQFQNQFFVGPDSGVFALLFAGKSIQCYKLPVEPGMNTIALKKLLTNTLVSLLQGVPAAKLGAPFRELVETHFSRPVSDSSGMRGSVIYIDSFGNAVINISKSLFEQERKNRSFSIHVRRATYKITSISTRYDNSNDGDLIALFNENDQMEISINRGNASSLIGIKQYDQILIEFNDNENS